MKKLIGQFANQEISKAELIRGLYKHYSKRIEDKKEAVKELKAKLKAENINAYYSEVQSAVAGVE